MRKILQISRTYGVKGLASRLVAFAYRRGIRPLLPSVAPVRYGGIFIADLKWGDRSVPALWRTKYLEDVPEYEAALVSGLKQHGRPGDRVLVVGGGLGVTATIAALQVGPTGQVECFEGAREGVERVRRTAEINGVSGRISVHHAVVARSISVYGTAPDRDVVAPADLPPCDLLELDCEGAEVDILREMVIRPRVILVETHGLFGASTAVVSGLLQERGYRVSDHGVAEPRLQGYCETQDIRVLFGVYGDDRPL